MIFTRMFINSFITSIFVHIRQTRVNNKQVLFALTTYFLMTLNLFNLLYFFFLLSLNIWVQKIFSKNTSQVSFIILSYTYIFSHKDLCHKWKEGQIFFRLASWSKIYTWKKNQKEILIIILFFYCTVHQHYVRCA